MKQAFGYFAMGLAGAVLALGGHELLRTENTTVSTPPPAPVKYVSLPGPNGVATTALDFTYAAENTVNAVVHV
ncbi:MAG: serine protease, partial [Candidatus Hydrogenedentes bacterium]|nr:serine protease [Candidatus Hydrogenedentota bacterium]